MAQGNGQGGVGWRRGGFTLLELLIAILVIGLVMALIIVGAVAVTRVARGAANQAAVNNIKAGLTQFEQEFGFAPPLVKDKASPAVQPVSNPSPDRRIAIYDVTQAGDQAALRTSTLAPTLTNPLADNRYSELSLSYYLAGGLDVRLNGNVNSPSIDGVDGPGLYKPARDGSFMLPLDVRRGKRDLDGGVSNRTSGVFPPFVDLGKAVKLFTDTTDPRYVYLRDSKEANVRYYRWLTGREQPAGSGNYVTEAPADFNIPPMVARDYTQTQFAVFKRNDARDINGSSPARSATWAIVTAGPNGLFGDEQPPEMTIDQMATRLGVPGVTGSSNPAERERQIRAAAEEDNIVEVGS